VSEARSAFRIGMSGTNSLEIGDKLFFSEKGVLSVLQKQTLPVDESYRGDGFLRNPARRYLAYHWPSPGHLSVSPLPCLRFPSSGFGLLCSF